MTSLAHDNAARDPAPAARLSADQGLRGAPQATEAEAPPWLIAALREAEELGDVRDPTPEQSARYIALKKYAKDEEERYWSIMRATAQRLRRHLSSIDAVSIYADMHGFAFDRTTGKWGDRVNAKPALSIPAPPPVAAVSPPTSSPRASAFTSSAPSAPPAAAPPSPPPRAPAALSSPTMSTNHAPAKGERRESSKAQGKGVLRESSKAQGKALMNACEAAGVTHAPRFIAHLIFDHTDTNSVAFCGEAALVALSGLCERAVRTHLRDLEAKGIIWTMRPSMKKRREGGYPVLPPTLVARDGAGKAVRLVRGRCIYLVPLFASPSTLAEWSALPNVRRGPRAPKPPPPPSPKAPAAKATKPKATKPKARAGAPAKRPATKPATARSR